MLAACGVDRIRREEGRRRDSRQCAHTHGQKSHPLDGSTTKTLALVGAGGKEPREENDCVAQPGGGMGAQPFRPQTMTYRSTGLHKQTARKTEGLRFRIPTRSSHQGGGA